MADPPRYPNTDNDTGAGPDRESATGTPRWVKVFGIIALVVVLLVVVVMLIGGEHGPGRDRVKLCVSSGPITFTIRARVAWEVATR